MPSPKSGNACTLVGPAAPRAAVDAADADPGAVDAAAAARQRAGAGGSGTTPVKPFKPGDPGDDPDAPPTTWIEIRLTDEAGSPVAGEPYAVTLADGTVASGTLDEDGLARVDGIPAGTCQVTFPDLDQDAWT